MRFAIGAFTPAARVNGAPALTDLVEDLDRTLDELDGDEGVINGLVVVAVRGDPTDVYERIIRALR